VDTYGFAAPGNPALAAKLAMMDASLTHRQTGIYAATFIAAAIATAFVAKKPLEMFDVALKFVPRRSRFYEVMADCLAMVKQADDWEKGYDAIHAKYKEFGHCLVFQECGLLINTAKFATDLGDAICKQVAQGCDTDSFGKLAGSLMGAYFGPGHLENRWIEPFNDDLRTTMASFHERSLSKVVQRIADLHLKLQNENKTSGEIVNGKEITGDVIDRDYGDLH
jgi:ADP-ribosylglycohydrolase